MTSVIYKIRNAITNKVYVGSAINFTKRKLGHLRQWSQGKAVNPKLLNAVRKYGADAFTFEVIEHCEQADLLTREEFWILEFKANETAFGYNVRHIPNSNLGLRFSASVRSKISAALKGRVFSEEHCAKISSAKKGVPPSAKEAERLARIHEDRKGKPMPAEQRRKISEALKGKVVSFSTCSKLSDASRKLSDQDIRDILELMSSGTPYREIRIRYQISQRTCCSIKRGTGCYGRFHSLLQ